MADNSEIWDELIPIEKFPNQYATYTIYYLSDLILSKNRLLPSLTPNKKSRTIIWKPSLFEKPYIPDNQSIKQYNH